MIERCVLDLTNVRGLEFWWKIMDVNCLIMTTRTCICSIQKFEGGREKRKVPSNWSYVEQLRICNNNCYFVGSCPTFIIMVTTPLSLVAGSLPTRNLWSLVSTCTMYIHSEILVNCI